MIIREATIEDIRSMQEIRNSVTENALSDPSLITYEDYKEYITGLGKGWVGIIDGEVAGFAIVSVPNCNVWALFIDRAFEGSGLAQRLHDAMIDWYFRQTQKTLWLSTWPGTRAEYFYRKNKWIEVGMHGKEIKFEMRFEERQDNT